MTGDFRRRAFVRSLREEVDLLRELRNEPQVETVVVPTYPDLPRLRPEVAPSSFVLFTRRDGERVRSLRCRCGFRFVPGYGHVWGKVRDGQVEVVCVHCINALLRKAGFTEVERNPKVVEFLGGNGRP